MFIYETAGSQEQFPAKSAKSLLLPGNTAGLYHFRDSSMC